MIYDVCVCDTTYTIEADNENEAIMIACDAYYEETGLSVYTDDESIIWNLRDDCDDEEESSYGLERGI